MPTLICDRVWIGGQHRARDAAWLAANRIDASINVAFDVDDPQLSARVIKVGLVDGPVNPQWMIDAAVEIVKGAMARGDAILVHCFMGFSRSVHVLARAISETRGMSYAEAHAMIKAKRPGVHEIGEIRLARAAPAK